MVFFMHQEVVMSLAWNVQMFVSWLCESLSVLWNSLSLGSHDAISDLQLSAHCSLWPELLMLVFAMAQDSRSGSLWARHGFFHVFSPNVTITPGALVLAVLLGCSRGWRCSISRHWSLCVILREIIFYESWNKFRKGSKILVRYLLQWYAFCFLLGHQCGSLIIKTWLWLGHTLENMEIFPWCSEAKVLSPRAHALKIAELIIIPFSLSSSKGAECGSEYHIHYWNSGVECGCFLFSANSCNPGKEGGMH